MSRLVVRNVEIPHPNGGFSDPAQALWAAGRGLDVPFFYDAEADTVHLDSVVHGRVVVIDPAHGGVDRRGHGPLGYYEADGTLDIARLLAGLLRAAGARAILTRAGDDTVAVAERLAIARGERPHLLLSLHTGGVRTGGGLRAAVIANYRRPFSSYRLAGLIAREMAETAGTPPFLQRFGWRARDVDGYYGLLLGSGVPAAIVECACHQYPEQERLLLGADYRNLLARAVYRAVCRFFDAELTEIRDVAAELRRLSERASAAPKPAGVALAETMRSAETAPAEATRIEVPPTEAPSTEPPPEPTLPAPPPTQPAPPPAGRPTVTSRPVPIPPLAFNQGQVYQVAPPGTNPLNIGVSGRAAEVIGGKIADSAMPLPPEFLNWPAPKPGGSPTKPHA